MSTAQKLGPAGRVANAFISSKLTPLFIGVAVLIGAFAVWKLPREEEPQIIVPMVDVAVSMPGASAREMEERVTKPMEKLLWEIPGVEYIYSTSSPGSSLAIVRFLVGQDEEKSLVRLNQKLQGHFDLIPPGASQPIVKPHLIDDVPILALTLSSKRYGDLELRRIAAQVHDAIKQVPDVSAVELIGGQRREVRIRLDEAKLEAHQLAPLAVAHALNVANSELTAGQFSQNNREYSLETGNFLRTAEDVRNVVVGAFQGRPVFVRDVAEVEDTGEDPTQYVRTVRPGTREFLPAVTIAVSKRKGTNAIDIKDRVLARVEKLKGTVLPQDVNLDITRNYGETAAEKSNDLLFHMLIAVVSVSLLVALVLGIRESLIVFIAIPVTLGLTLAVFYLYGYTLNRITLFALIFSIGILVDDAIVVVENIVRHWRLPENEGRPPVEVAVEAVNEVGNPTILATLAVVAAILPMAFVGGLMGPYMRPIPIGATAAMVFSLMVAFVVTPWAAVRILKPHSASEGAHHEDFLTRQYRRVMGTILHRTPVRWGFLFSIVLLLLLSASLVYVGFVKVKMLPFDNKSEFQVIVDMPDGTTLEETERVTTELASAALEQPEVVNLQTYAGTASPYNFNGLVRHYYLRRGAEPRRHSDQSSFEERPRPAEPRHCETNAPATPSHRGEVRRSHQSGRGAARAAGARRRWWRKCTGLRPRPALRWRGRFGIYGGAPTVWWMSIGTWKTISRSIASSWIARKPGWPAFRRRRSPGRYRPPRGDCRRDCCTWTPRKKTSRSPCAWIGPHAPICSNWRR